MRRALSHSTYTGRGYDVRGRHPDSWLAARVALLSFPWPGLGHLALGRGREALLFAAAGLIAILPILWMLRDGPEILLGTVLLVPDASRLLIACTIAFAAVRLVAMGHAIQVAGGIGWRRRTGPARTSRDEHARPTAILVGLLSILIVVPHLGLAWVGASFLGASEQIYVGTDDREGSPDGGAGLGPDLPGDIGALPTPNETPREDERVNVLLIGADSGLGYNHSLTDTMILVSVDPAAKDVAMVSIPRDTARFEMYNGAKYTGKLNALVTWAAAHPKEFPDGGIGTLTREVGFMLGVPIHYYGFVNLAGFKAVVDAVGGIDIVNERAIQDANYTFPDGKRGFFLTAGPHHLDGRTALAYARSRYGPGDNDFTRSRRQQQVLQALRAKLTDPAVLPQLPDVLKAIGKAVHTSFPASGVADMLKVAREMDDATVEQVVLGPPYARVPANGGGSYILVQDRARIQALSVKLFGEDSAFAQPSPSP